MTVQWPWPIGEELELVRWRTEARKQVKAARAGQSDAGRIAVAEQQRQPQRPARTLAVVPEFEFAVGAFVVVAFVVRESVVVVVVGEVAVGIVRTSC